MSENGKRGKKRKRPPRRKVPFSELSPAYVEELWARIGMYAEMEGDCTVFDRHPSSNGYGRLSIKGVLRPAHRFVYERAYGEQSENTEIDHLCHNRACIRLAHLEAVDRGENARRRRSHGFHYADGSRRSRRYKQSTESADAARPKENER